MVQCRSTLKEWSAASGAEYLFRQFIDEGLDLLRTLVAESHACDRVVLAVLSLGEQAAEHLGGHDGLGINGIV